MNQKNGDIKKFARSTGMLFDRCLQREKPFGAAWLVGPNQVVTCAHHIVPYLDYLSALKIKFPAIGQEWQISEVYFHPRFDLQIANELVQRSLLEPVPAMALQDHNIALLKLERNLSELDLESRTQFNRKLAGQAPTRLKGLAGPVDELGLALVIQTITSSRKDGCLVFSDERNRPLAKLFCRDGKVVFAKFGNLENEAAIYQMFAQRLSGQFHFLPQSKPDWTVYSMIERSTDSLLLEAHRRIDEIPGLLRSLGGEGAIYARAVDLLELDSLPSDVRVVAEKVWHYLDGNISVDCLGEMVGLDNQSIYRAVDEMYKAGQVLELSSADDDGLTPLMPLNLAPHALLSAWDQIWSLGAHATTGRAQLRSGNLFGLIRPNDPWHLLHSIKLPAQAAGSAILKDGAVVGVHCGNLPLDPKLHALPDLMSQMIWVESVQQMLYDSPKAVAALRPGKNSVGMKVPELLSAAENNDKIQCPKCTALMVKQAKFCGTCGQRLQS
ncbi:MAG: DUF4388 domain-containing protein [Candidatus Obscuribacterales bacterium]|nr:DUF4388 domain-containing protein [Candidatus Obscuribacterales bacterium]